MSRIWTPAQSAAMRTLGETLLISAAAGSGKTATLTERIIRRLTDPERPVELSRLLIVTFTRAAAAELRERIAKALGEAIAADPGNRHLQKQLIGLGGAHISTIDSFVREPIKAHFAELGLPAASRIADEAELAPLRERVMGEIMDEFYLKYALDRTAEAFSLLDGNPFADLCDALTSSKNDAVLIPTLLKLYERLLSFPAGIGRLKAEAEDLEDAARLDFFACDHGRVLATWLQDLCASALPFYEEACELLAADAAATKAYGRAFEGDYAFFRDLAGAQSYAAAYVCIGLYKNERLAALTGTEGAYDAIKERRTSFVNTVKDLRKAYFADSPETLTAQMLDTAKMCRVLYDLLSEYDRRILAEKQARGLCDFTDNRRYLLRLLRGEDGQPSALGRDFAARFDEVYIDEYQDVDEVQDEIFRLVGGNHRFMVGDIKQSIYMFRGADPSVFARYRRDLPSLDPAEEQPEIGAGHSIFMSDNFRCDEGVIRVTNAICGHIFRACPDTIGYKPEDDLGFAKMPPCDGYAAPHVQISVVEKPPHTRSSVSFDTVAEAALADAGNGVGLSEAELEATYVANEIARLLRERVPLADGTPIQPKDIVILMRNQTALSAYMAALSAMGIPTGSEELDTMEAGRDLLHGGDMMYLVNLLRVINDPDGDIPLSEVLRAPFPGLTLEEVLTVRQAGGREGKARSLYAGLEEYPLTEGATPALCEKIAAFISWIERYRSLCATQPADGILRLLRRDERCACRHTEAFLYLYESARTCRSATFVSLYTFLRFFERTLQTATYTVPGKSAEGRVSIMTIHKSKGLEFPVCFVVRCGQTFSPKSQIGDLLFQRETGLAMKLYRREGDRPVKVDTTLRATTALAIKLSEREEEMRVLYVAMTRARERLYLVGTATDKELEFEAGDRFATLSASSYLRWIRAGLAAHPEVREHYELTVIPADSIAPEERLAPMGTHAGAQELDPIAAGYRAILEHHTEPNPMEFRLRTVPTKVPASRMRAGMLDDCIFYDTDQGTPDKDKLPLGSDASFCDAQSLAAIRESLRLMTSGEDTDEFELLLGENRRPTPAEKGTATHLFLQYCNYDNVVTAGIAEEIARLCERGFINNRTADILDRGMLEAFFSSRFFARIQNAERTERELKFNRFLPLRDLTADTAFAEALGERTLHVQGSIDLLAHFADGHIEIADYKTDRLTPEERQNPACLAAHMRERHGAQLEQYAAAVEALYGRRPEKIYIYSLPLGEAVEICL